MDVYTMDISKVDPEWAMFVDELTKATGYSESVTYPIVVLRVWSVIVFVAGLALGLLVSH